MHLQDSVSFSHLMLLISIPYSYLLKQVRRQRRVVGLTSDGEEIYAKESDESDVGSSYDDDQKDHRRIGQKNNKMYTVSVAISP